MLGTQISSVTASHCDTCQGEDSQLCGTCAGTHLLLHCFVPLKHPLRPVILQTEKGMHGVKVNTKLDLFGTVLGLGQFTPAEDLIQRFYIQVSILLRH